MAVMIDAERIKVWSYLMRTGNFPVNCLKADLRAAVNAADQWVDDNQASYSAALPQPFRSASTADQKSLLLVYVVMRRQGKLYVEGD